MTKNSLLFILGSRLIGKPLDFDSSITGSYPVSPAKYAGVAQLVEQLTCPIKEFLSSILRWGTSNQQVAGSIPVASCPHKANLHVVRMFKLIALY